MSFILTKTIKNMVSLWDKKKSKDISYDLTLILICNIPLTAMEQSSDILEAKTGVQLILPSEWQYICK